MYENLSPSVFFIDMDSHLPALESFYALLNPQEHMRMSCLQSLAVRQRAVITRGSLKKFLSHLLQIPPLEIQFYVNDKGKPYVAPLDEVQPLYFNVSHSQKYALIAISLTAECGVDIQLKKSMMSFDSIAKRMFCAEEYEYLAALNSNEKTEMFYKLWARKEALTKMLGQSLYQTFRKRPVPYAQEMNVAQPIQWGKHQCWLRDWPCQDSDYVAAVAWCDRAC